MGEIYVILKLTQSSNVMKNKTEWSILLSLCSLPGSLLMICLCPVISVLFKQSERTVSINSPFYSCSIRVCKEHITSRRSERWWWVYAKDRIYACQPSTEYLQNHNSPLPYMVRGTCCDPSGSGEGEKNWPLEWGVYREKVEETSQKRWLREFRAWDQEYGCKGPARV